MFYNVALRRSYRFCAHRCTRLTLRFVSHERRIRAASDSRGAYQTVPHARSSGIPSMLMRHSTLRNMTHGLRKVILLVATERQLSKRNECSMDELAPLMSPSYPPLQQRHGRCEASRLDPNTWRGHARKYLRVMESVNLNIYRLAGKMRSGDGAHGCGGGCGSCGVRHTARHF